MSRIGKLPIIIPEGVTVELQKGKVSAKGPKGELTLVIHPFIDVEQNDNLLQVKPNKNNKLAKSLYGTTGRLVNNLVIGVSEGFSKKLEINGVGYKAQVKGKDLELNVGFSHNVIVTPPEEIKINVEKNIIEVSGIDKQLVGQVAANIRSVRPPEPYKGKGIKYTDETIRRKAGKAAKATAA